MTKVLAECTRDFPPTTESGIAALSERLTFHSLESRVVCRSKLDVLCGPEHSRAVYSLIIHHQFCTELYSCIDPLRNIPGTIVQLVSKYFENSHMQLALALYPKILQT